MAPVSEELRAAIIQTLVARVYAQGDPRDGFMWMLGRVSARSLARDCKLLVRCLVGWLGCTEARLRRGAQRQDQAARR